MKTSTDVFTQHGAYIVSIKQRTDAYRGGREGNVPAFRNLSRR